MINLLEGEEGGIDLQYDLGVLQVIRGQAGHPVVDESHAIGVAGALLHHG